MGNLTPLGRLRAALHRGGSTQLGVGPMSKNCVDAVIEVANSSKCALMLIASRRQIEAAEFGGGYVNGWSTEEWARYVRERDRGGYVVLCRDHGGPWQNQFETEQGLSLEDAMETACRSFTADIRSGLDIIHLDPSIDPSGAPPGQEEILERLFDLYTHCAHVAADCESEIGIEIGTEEQSGGGQDLELLTEVLERTQSFCARNDYTPPLFVVAQTGTLVKETRNVGTLDDPFRQEDSTPAEIRVPQVLDICRRHTVHLKEHNADYLSSEALGWHPRLGIDAVNIAPEFGVGETRCILAICREMGLDAEADAFLELAYQSGKWKKWMLSGTTATDEDRAIIAGHYVFAKPEFGDIAARIRRCCQEHGFDFDSRCRDHLKMMLTRIMTLFRLYHGAA